MITVAILTVSDSSFKGLREDRSGPVLREHCQTRQWPVAASGVVADDAESIAGQLAEWADHGLATLILTTGGTGVGPRDNTPEATRSVLDRELAGVAELMRMKGLEQTPYAVLSRAVAGTRKRSLIINLPGSPKGALHSLAAIEHLIPHIIELLEGRTEHARN